LTDSWLCDANIPFFGKRADFKTIFGIEVVHAVSSAIGVALDFTSTEFTGCHAP
jgi:hypothetical protein